MMDLLIEHSHGCKLKNEKILLKKIIKRLFFLKQRIKRFFSKKKELKYSFMH